MSKRKLLFWALFFTLFFEFVTIFARFGLGLQSTRDTATTIGLITRGIRIHHGYIGLLIILWSLMRRGRKFIGPITHHHGRIFGIALLASDLIHHFLILWPIEGHHQFDLFYPPHVH
ncbi:MAG TPA: hypothetical protein VLL52_25340 [Anaerolineae bacterium]|nr:hypothetical protein [Anaerolineae bacterium]